MFNDLNQIKKAAFQTAAFLILSISPAGFASARLLQDSPDTIKAKATTLLLQKQKNQALAAVAEYLQTETNKNNIMEMNDVMETIAKTFMSKESQEAYESSLNATVDNAKEAVRQAELCLKIEPQNSECLVQRIRLAARSKNPGVVEANMQLLTKIIPNTKTEQWLLLLIKKADTDFKNKSILKKLPDRPSDDLFALLVLELDRSFAAKNFSRSRDIIQHIDRNFSDWPDIVFYKQKIEFESAEQKAESGMDAPGLYVAKCKNLSKSSTRKYRYDFDLCVRGQP